VRQAGQRETTVVRESAARSCSAASSARRASNGAGVAKNCRGLCSKFVDDAWHNADRDRDWRSIRQTTTTRVRKMTVHDKEVHGTLEESAAPPILSSAATTTHRHTGGWSSDRFR